MNASRTKPETHWKSIGAIVANRQGSLADLDLVLTGKRVIDDWIAEGYSTANRRAAAKAQSMVKSEAAQ